MWPGFFSFSFFQRQARCFNKPWESWRKTFQNYVSTCTQYSLAFVFCVLWNVLFILVFCWLIPRRESSMKIHELNIPNYTLYLFHFNGRTNFPFFLFRIASVGNLKMLKQSFGSHQNVCVFRCNGQKWTDNGVKLFFFFIFTKICSIEFFVLGTSEKSTLPFSKGTLDTFFYLSIAMVQEWTCNNIMVTALTKIRPCNWSSLIFFCASVFPCLANVRFSSLFGVGKGRYCFVLVRKNKLLDKSTHRHIDREPVWKFKSSKSACIVAWHFVNVRKKSI